MARYNVYGTPKQGYFFDISKGPIYGSIETQLDSFTHQENVVIFFNKRRYVLDPTVAVERAQGIERYVVNGEIREENPERVNRLGMSFDKFSFGYSSLGKEMTELPSPDFFPDGFSY